ncbi:MAG: NADH-quinone oxidoreductase subunit A [Chloroflexota bacterium]|nr:NADH-quinone oxidoreductase subunit A [Chloroflexota bacterium]
MLENFGALGLFIFVSIGFALLMIGIPFLLKFIGVVPRNPSSIKNDIYECGMRPIKGAWIQFNFHYYTFAILFVALDIMSIFLLAWAVNFGVISRELQVYGFYAIAVFVLVLVVGLVYAWKKKALEWK